MHFWKGMLWLSYKFLTLMYSPLGKICNLWWSAGLTRHCPLIYENKSTYIAKVFFLVMKKKYLDDQKWNADLHGIVRLLAEVGRERKWNKTKKFKERPFSFFMPSVLILITSSTFYLLKTSYFFNKSNLYKTTPC